MIFTQLALFRCGFNKVVVQNSMLCKRYKRLKVTLNIFWSVLHLFVAVKENLPAMGCFDSNDPVIQGQKTINEQLEKKLKSWDKKYRKAIKVLLLGMANCQLCLCVMINNNKLTF